MLEPATLFWGHAVPVEKAPSSSGPPWLPCGGTHRGPCRDPAGPGPPGSRGAARPPGSGQAQNRAWAHRHGFDQQQPLREMSQWRLRTTLSRPLRSFQPSRGGGTRQGAQDASSWEGSPGLWAQSGPRGEVPGEASPLQCEAPRHAVLL